MSQAGHLGQVVGDVEAFETDVGWTFRFGDGRITRLDIDHRFTLLLAGGGRIEIEGPFTLDRGDGTTEPIPAGEAAHDIVAAVSLFDRTVHVVHATWARGLRVHLDDGTVLRVDVGPEAAGWRMVDQGREQWTGTPTGDVIWSLSR